MGRRNTLFCVVLVLALRETSSSWKLTIVAVLRSERNFSEQDNAMPPSSGDALPCEQGDTGCLHVRIKELYRKHEPSMSTEAISLNLQDYKMREQVLLDELTTKFDKELLLRHNVNPTNFGQCQFL